MPRGPISFHTGSVMAAVALEVVDPRPTQAVIGVDPSATGTGLAAIGTDGELISTKRLSGTGLGVDRLCRIERDFAEWLEEISDGGTLIVHAVMEGYGFHIRDSQSHKLGEVGGVLKKVIRSMLPEPACYPTLPATSQVKKYCLGKGTGVTKAQMLKGVYKKWGADLKTDDEAEAYTMAQIGLGLLLGTNVKYEQEVLDALLRPPAKKDQERRPLVWAELPDEKRYEYGDPAEYLRTLNTPRRKRRK